MSAETTNVVSVPTAEDNQQHEKIVNEEANAAEQGDTPPSKNNSKKHEKEICEAEKTEGVETSSTKFEETPVVNQVEPPVVIEVAKADHVPVQNVEANYQCQPTEPVANVPEGEKPSVKAVEEEEIAIEAVEKEVEKTQTIEAIENEEAEEAHTSEAVAENEPEKTEVIEDDKNKSVEVIAIEAVDNEAGSTPVDEVALAAVKNEQKIQAREASENNEVKNIAIEAIEKESETKATEACEDKAVEKIPIKAVKNEPETQADEACEDKAVEKTEIEAVEKEAEKTQVIEADENKQEETPAIEEQIDESAKVGNFESNTSSEIVKPAEESVEGKKETTADEGKAACELTNNEEAQTVEKEAGVVDNVKDGTMQCKRAAEKEKEGVKVAQVTKESDQKTEEASVENEVKSEDGTNELKNETDQVIEKSLEGEQKSDRDLVEGLVKEDEYKDIKVNGEAKNESKTDVPPNVESCKDGDHETQKSKDQVQVVSSKPAQKPSGNLISKVKLSLVKVKKAIIGKSPSSKVLTPEIKGNQENVK